MEAQAALVAARSLHFIAILQLCGAVLALAWIAAKSPARSSVRRLGWASLSLAVVSGAGWLMVQAAAMSGHAMVEADTLVLVLRHTQFGHAVALRAIMLAGLAVLLARGRTPWLAVILAAGIAASLAWGGHAAAGEGRSGAAHLSGDVVHLLAAAAWLGGLLPLALALRSGDTAQCIQAARRFSRLGIVAVLAVAASGLANGYFLVGSVTGLVGTPYGHLLLVKLGAFAAMLALAACNRQILTPRLAAGPAPLVRNTLAEAGLGAVVLILVGALGSVPPALHAEIRWPLPYRLENGRLLAATPMSFARPTIPLSAEAVVSGRTRYERACVGCHEAMPQGLTPGDTAWWATRGHAEPPRPEAADAEGWAVVHYLATRAAASVPLSPEVGPGVAAPDFDVETASGEQASLVGEAVTLLVFFDDSRLSRGRVTQLAMRRPAIEAQGAQVIAIPLPGGDPAAELAAIVPPDVAEAYGLLEMTNAGHTELLVDRTGRIRARWRPDDALDWRAAKVLSRQIETLNAEANPDGHGH